MAGYEDLTRRLVTALQDSISADINGASENEASFNNALPAVHEAQGMHARGELRLRGWTGTEKG